MLVFPNGNILDVQGPYLADARNNDASTLQHALERHIIGIKGWLKDGDIIVADRAYRDAEDLLRSLGIGLQIPHHLSAGKKQHTTLKAKSLEL